MKPVHIANSMNNSLSLTSNATISEDDSSFVVISTTSSRSPISADENAKTSEKQDDFQFPTMPPSMVQSSIRNGFTSVQASYADLSQDEIVCKLNAVLDENNYLKQTLYENNSAMKTQFDTLVKWQEAVIDVHKQHKTKFDDTKQLIADLRLENLNLKRKLKTYEEMETENLLIKSKFESTESQKSGSGDDITEGKWNKLVEQLSHRLNLVETARKENLLELESLRKQNQNLTEELLSKQIELTSFSTCEEQKVLTSFNAEQTLNACKSIDKNSKMYENVHLYGEHIKNLKLFFELQKHRQIQLKSCLKSALNILSDQKSVAEIENVLDRLQAEANDQTDEAAMSKFIDAQNNFHTIFFEYQMTKQEIENTRHQLDSTLVDLGVSNQAIISLRKDFAASKAEVIELMKLNEELSESARFLKKELSFKQTTPTVSSQEMVRMNEIVATLENQIKANEDVILNQRAQLTEVGEKLKTLQSENEIFKFQAEQYQADFVQEKELRIQTQDQKNVIAEDLRLLQRRNEQLIEQIEKQIGKQKPNVSSSSAPSAPLISRFSNEAPVAAFSCPICNKTFRTLHSLEDHMDQCLTD